MQSIASLISMKPLEDIGNLDDFEDTIDGAERSSASAKISELANQFGLLVESNQDECRENYISDNNISQPNRQNSEFLLLLFIYIILLLFDKCVVTRSNSKIM